MVLRRPGPCGQRRAKAEVAGQTHRGIRRQIGVGRVGDVEIEIVARVEDGDLGSMGRPADESKAASPSSGSAISGVIPGFTIDASHSSRSIEGWSHRATVAVDAEEVYRQLTLPKVVSVLATPVPTASPRIAMA